MTENEIIAIRIVWNLARSTKDSLIVCPSYDTLTALDELSDAGLIEVTEPIGTYPVGTVKVTSLA